MARYAISKKSNVRVPSTVNTKNSIYPVLSFTGFRKFKTRDVAREYKRCLSTPSNYVIVDTQNMMAVR